MILEYMKMSLFETSKKQMFFTIFIFFLKTNLYAFNANSICISDLEENI